MESSTSEVTRVAIDTSKVVFTLHGVDGEGRVLLRRNLRRAELEAFFTSLPPVEVALEACAGSRYWGRMLAARGHRVRLIPPEYVKPFVKRGKNDRNHAEAICVAAAQPSIGEVAVKSAERQARTMLLSVRDLLGRQRTQLEPGQFQSGRHFAAWLGLVPRQHSSGGKQRLGGISRTGDERLRQLLVLGASALIRQAKPGRANVSPWLLELLKRRPRKLVAVAWANKVARIVWAMMTTGAAYRGATAA